jgi:hypothetical protein
MSKLKPERRTKSRKQEADDLFEVDRYEVKEGPGHNVSKSLKRPEKVKSIIADLDTTPKKKRKKVVEEEPREKERTAVKKKKKVGVPRVAEAEPKKARTDQDASAKLKRAKKKIQRTVDDADDLMERVKKDLTRHEPKDDNDYRIVYLEMFKKQRRIIKKTEKKVLSRTNKGGGREIYQLSAMYSQLRETIADLRSITDLSEHADRLIEMAVQPMFTRMIQNITDNFYELKVRTKDRVKEKYVKEVMDLVDDATVELGRKLQVHYEEVSTKIRDLLIG